MQNQAINESFELNLVKLKFLKINWFNLKLKEKNQAKLKASTLKSSLTQSDLSIKFPAQATQFWAKLKPAWSSSAYLQPNLC